MACAHCNLSGHYKPTCPTWLGQRSRLSPAPVVFTLPDVPVTFEGRERFARICAHASGSSERFARYASAYSPTCGCHQCEALTYLRPDLHVAASLNRDSFRNWRRNEDAFTPPEHNSTPENAQIWRCRVEAQQRNSFVQAQWGTR
jgi:hypothetical protein